ncbi:hypothetical protein CEY16_07390 [Halalkalibacillus sediminis]|uniref:ATPase F0F1 n=1 Tax=Halalkalibacillus sediminis TaxID=2018042 RepID=A0A2I0QTS8_9BACI|nr:AtpZ/AtpI family protein [Halalkalibacillus sediminis]PKR77747.1 hypothetical protein CEY16_07390 [Halalkalibacillus sediminis]
MSEYWIGVVPLNNNPLRGMAITTTILSYLSGSVIVGIFLGRWIDDFLQTPPLFMIIGLLLGLAAGVYGTIRIVQKYFAD